MSCVGGVCLADFRPRFGRVCIVVICVRTHRACFCALPEPSFLYSIESLICHQEVGMEMQPIGQTQWIVVVCLIETLCEVLWKSTRFLLLCFRASGNFSGA